MSENGSQRLLDAFQKRGKSRIGSFFPQQFVLPVELQWLPFNLQRAHLYPPDPELAARGVEDYRARVRPFYLPQKFGFRRWKTPPHRPDWDSAVTSPVRALQSAAVQMAATSAGSHNPAPNQSAAERAAALGARRLPSPFDNISPAIRVAQQVANAPPLVRGAPVNMRRIPPEGLHQIGRQLSTVPVAAWVANQVGLLDALTRR